MEKLRLAGCIVKNLDGEILLLHRNTAKRKQWEIPGGKLDPDEDASKTAAREVREEAGIEVEIISELGTREFNEDSFTMSYTWFLAEIIDGVAAIQEPRVHDQCGYFSMTALDKMSSELSPNARNFLDEVAAGRVSI
ncbi:MAG TPA: NUDIX hydrolase [Streptosporangiaceae bacterium]|jgi:8-oxo-dGTP diphosphatase|nr:NUDIX hydrolase [Streptosporangiaceae bacterium]